MAVHEKLRVGDDRGQRMSQIVGDRARHAPDGGELFRFQKVALALQQAGTHAIEGSRQLCDLIASMRLERVVEVSALERAHSTHEISERPSEGMRHKED